MKRPRRTKNDVVNWMWQFSKVLVVICTAIYAVGRLYAYTAMWVQGDLSSLTIIIEQDSDILKTCVFGYFGKSAIENALKIRLGYKYTVDGGFNTDET